MFAHLDDPNPPIPGQLERATVAARVRRRRRRGMLVASLTAVVAAGVAAALVVPGLRSASASVGLTAGPGSRTGSQPAVADRSFSGAFVPDEVIAANRAAWLVDSESGGGCRVARLDTATLSTVSYRLASCGDDLTAGDGALFLQVATAVKHDQTYAIHIERFSTSTHRATLLATVSATMALGSGIAHTRLAYADGSLWYYYPADGTPVVARLSPATGAVERIYRSVPAIGGTQPVIVSTPADVWFTGGGGSGSEILAINARTGAARTLRPSIGSVSDYAATTLDGDVYLAYLRGGRNLTMHLAHLSPSGVLLRRSGPEPVGTWLATAGGNLLSVGPSASCSAGFPIRRVDPATLRMTPLTTLPVPGSACEDGGESAPAAVGDQLLVLYSEPGTATVYRVSLPGASSSAAG